HIVARKKITQFISDLNTLCHFYQHSFFNAVEVIGFVVVDEHESAMTFPKENDHGSKFCFFSFNLTVGSDANLEAKTFFRFTPDGVYHGFMDGEQDAVAVKFSP